MMIAVIGYGRFGKFFSKFLKKLGRVRIFDIRTPLHSLKEFDWIMLAVPISKMDRVTKKISPFLKKGSLVFDVCSVKIWPCKIMQKNLPKNISIIGTHPLFGPDSAKHGLKAHIIGVTPIRTTAKHLHALLNFFKSIGLRVIKTTPEKHDKAVAKTQALVHFLSRAVPPINKEPLSTATYKTLAKIFESLQHDTLELFFDMQTKNPYAKKIRKEFLDRCVALEKKISSHHS